MSREHTDMLILTLGTQSSSIMLLTKELSCMVGIRVVRREGLVPPLSHAGLLAGSPPAYWLLGNVEVSTIIVMLHASGRCREPAGAVT
jgi:hypothetical protein